VQPFDFPFFEEFGSTFQQTAPTPTTYVAGETYDLMDFSGNGDVTAAVVNVDLNLTPPRASSSGCEATDFSATWRQDRSAAAGHLPLRHQGGQRRGGRRGRRTGNRDIHGHARR
jgi:hypothetical protein